MNDVYIQKQTTHVAEFRTHIFFRAPSHISKNSHIVTFFSGHSHKNAKHKLFCQSSHMSAKNSKKSSKKLPEFSCLNPDCPVGGTAVLIQSDYAFESIMTWAAEFSQRPSSLQQPPMMPRSKPPQKTERTGIAS